MPILNSLHPKSFVQASAVRTPGKQSVRSILKFERANRATQPVLQSPLLASPAIPFSNYPEEENCCKKKQQINRYQSSKTDANHGLTPPDGDCGRAISLPH
jgi:hypothetical protein